MTSFGNFVRTFGADESGATAIEYALIVAGISAIIVAVVGTTGEALNNSLFNKVATALAE